MKIALLLLLVVLILLSMVYIAWQKLPAPPVPDVPQTSDRTYATWDTMEYDKCVAAWLIVRFIDKDAKFIFYPQNSEIAESTTFDVPGAAWSRKHRKCTSDCILESLELDDPAVDKIVSMAHNIELNFWQLERFPDAQKSFAEVMAIFEMTPDPMECFLKTRAYFDTLYERLSNSSSASGP